MFDTISKNEYWIKPIVIESEHHLILDGHHRFDVAKRMGLTRIPVVIVNYKDIEIWSLRSDRQRAPLDSDLQRHDSDLSSDVR